MNEITGDLIVNNFKFAFIVSRFNEVISDRLLDGAIDTFKRHGGISENITIIKVPGAYEIPLTAKKIAEKNRFDAIICLGVIIKGETPHFDFVSTNASGGISSVSIETGIPISFGILTTENIDQAIQRSGIKLANQGRTATVSAIEMVSLLKKI